jgi:hypothetical protein
MWAGNQNAAFYADKANYSGRVQETRKMAARKAKLTKKVLEKVYGNRNCAWTVQHGCLKRGQGNPGKTEHLFKVVGEKLPFKCLSTVKKHVKEKLGLEPYGVYVAHDSMGCPRYIGRGNVFQRLETRHTAQVLELQYFSFYLVSEKKHEREVETLLIRAAGFLLEFNSRKKRVGIAHGNIRDYEAGTLFYERHYKKGKKT